MTRMRYIKEAVEEVKLLNPNTGITESLLRTLVREGKIPYLQVGKNRCLINFDAMMEFFRTLPCEIPEEKFEDASSLICGVPRINIKS